MVEFLGQFCERSPTDTELEDYMMLLGDLGSFSMYTLINSGSNSIPLYQQQGGTGMGILDVWPESPIWCFGARAPSLLARKTFT